MKDKISVKNPKQGQDVVHRHSVPYNLFILILTLFSLVVMVGLIIRPVVNYAVLWRVDFFICMIFLIDFLVNLCRAPGRAGYFFKQGGWLDLLGAIPTMLGLSWTSLFRLARLNRLVWIAKYLQGKERGEVIKETRQTSAKTALLTMIITAC
jgi:voltage-gated potassium channel